MGKKNIGSKKYDIALKKLEKNTSHGKVLSQIVPGSTVLECGCASGYMTRWMKEKLDCHVSVIEIDESCYEEARPFAEDGYCGDLMEKGWSDYYAGKSFDYILFADVLEHLTDPLEVLTRAVSFLKDDGKIIVSIPNIAHNDIILKLVNDRFDYTSIGLLDNTHVHFWGQKNLDEFFSDAGLEITVMDGTIVPTGSTEQLKDSSAVFDQNILSDLAERPLGNIYQYVVTAQKRSYLSDHEAAYVDLLPRHEGKAGNKVKPVTVYSTLYYAYEQDFTAENSSVFTNLLPERATKEIQLSLKLPGKFKRLRIDPCEGFCCQVNTIDVVCDGVKLPVKGDNGFCVENNYFFLDKDPQLFVDLPDTENEKQLDVIFLLRLFTPEEESYLKELKSLVDDRASHTETIITSTVFFSDGSDYSNEKSVIFQKMVPQNLITPIQLNFDIPLPAGCKKVRIDPCEGYYCLLSNVQMIYEGKRLDYTTPNGVLINDLVLLQTEDPQIEVIIQDCAGSLLHTDMKVKLFDIRDMTLGIVNEKLKSYEEKLSALTSSKEEELLQIKVSYEEKLSALTSSKEAELSQIKASYEEKLSALASSKEAELSHVKTSYEEELSALASSKEAELSHVKTSYEEELSALTSMKEDELLQIKTSYEEKLSALTSMKEDELSQVKASYEEKLSDKELMNNSAIQKLLAENRKLNAVANDMMNLCARKDQLLIDAQKMQG